MVKHRLKAAADAAKVKADEKAESYHGTEAKQQALKIAESLRDDKQGDKDGQAQAKSSKSAKSSSGRPKLDDDEQSVAGRKVMKSGKQETLKTNKDVIKGDDKDENEEPDHKETEGELKAHAELSEILKKSPSTSAFMRNIRESMLTHDSDHLFKDLLSVLEESETHFAGQIQDPATAVRRRARCAPVRKGAAGVSWSSHWAENCTKHTRAGQEHGRR